MQSLAVLADSSNKLVAADPIILTGAPRTGVRLLAAILDGHPRLASGPDLPIVATLVHQWADISASLGVNHARNHCVTPDASRAAFRAAALELLAPRLKRTGKTRFVLQTFTAILLLDEFAELFPGAQFVLMIRNPYDVIGSLLQCDWRDVRNGQPLPYTSDPIAAAKFSLEFMNTGLRRARPLQESGRLITVAYEDVCADPAAAMTRLGAFLRETAPEPLIMPESAKLVTQSPDNPHPALRAGAVGPARTAVARNSRPRPELGRMHAALDQLCRALGYRTGAG
jgi:hypothetical protein